MSWRPFSARQSTSDFFGYSMGAGLERHAHRHRLHQVEVASGALAGRRGERCCSPADKAAKRRHCGPRKRDHARGKEYIVCGFFDGDVTATMTKKEGEESEEGADAVYHSNTYLGPRGRGARDPWRRSLIKSWLRATLRCLRTSLPPRCNCPQSRQERLPARERD